MKEVLKLSGAAANVQESFCDAEAMKEVLKLSGAAANEKNGC